MKICTKCKIEKPLTDFHKKKGGKYGVRAACKLCTSAHSKAYYKSNKDKIKAYHEANKDNIKEYNKAYREANKDKLAEQSKAYREANKDKIREQKKEYREANKDNIKEYNKAYREANKDNVKEYHKGYREANKDKIKAYNKAYIKQRLKEDHLFKFCHNTRSLISIIIKNKGYTKKSKTYQILGCTYEEFKEHIERQFTKGMTWDNQGEWHLDHIYPVSLAKNEEELIKLNHYTNFQPLWAEDNLKKSNKIENGKQIKLL